MTEQIMQILPAKVKCHKEPRVGCGGCIKNEVLDDCSAAIEKANLVRCPSLENIKLVINEVSTLTNGPYADELNTGEIARALLALLRGVNNDKKRIFKNIKSMGKKS